MVARTRRVIVVTLVLTLAACTSGAGGNTPTPAPVASTAPSPTSTTVMPPASTEPSEQTPAFPVSSFTVISEDPMPEALAAKLQAALALHDVTGGGGMSATVMTPEGTWSGTTGKADGVRDLQVDDQFAIASITKSVVAAQVMLMAEAGELDLDDPVADHLPRDLTFDTNGATIRQLLGHRSGIPDDYDWVSLRVDADPARALTPVEGLQLLPAERASPDTTFEYSGTNYLLLGLMIEHLRERPLAEALRGGALAIDGLERLVVQPYERPTDPMAMPGGGPADGLANVGGYLPSLGLSSANPAAGGIASDARSVARWWRAFCAGEVVSQASLTEMSKLQPADYLGDYGLGIYDPTYGDGPAFGHTGQVPGFMSWAGCLPDDEAVIVVLTNHEVEDGQLAYSHGLARPLLDALRSK